MVSFPRVSPPKPCMRLLRATCPAHLTILDSITRIILVDVRSLIVAIRTNVHSSREAALVDVLE